MKNFKLVIYAQLDSLIALIVSTIKAGWSILNVIAVVLLVVSLGLNVLYGGNKDV